MSEAPANTNDNLARLEQLRARVRALKETEPLPPSPPPLAEESPVTLETKPEKPRAKRATPKKAAAPAAPTGEELESLAVKAASQARGDDNIFGEPKAENDFERARRALEEKRQQLAARREVGEPPTAASIPTAVNNRVEELRQRMERRDTVPEAPPPSPPREVSIDLSTRMAELREQMETRDPPPPPPAAEISTPAVPFSAPPPVFSSPIEQTVWEPAARVVEKTVDEPAQTQRRRDQAARTAPTLPRIRLPKVVKTFLRQFFAVFIWTALALIVSRILVFRATGHLFDIFNEDHWRYVYRFYLSGRNLRPSLPLSIAGCLVVWFFGSILTLKFAWKNKQISQFLSKILEGLAFPITFAAKKIKKQIKILLK